MKLNVRSGAEVREITCVVVLGQAALLTNETVNVPGAVEVLRSTSPVAVFRKFSPPGEALKVPPVALRITGTGLLPLMQKVESE